MISIGGITISIGGITISNLIACSMRGGNNVIRYPILVMGSELGLNRSFSQDWGYLSL